MNGWVKVSDFQNLIEEHIFVCQKIFCGSAVKYSNLPPLPPSPSLSLCLSLLHTSTHTWACAPWKQVELVGCCAWGGRYRHLSSTWLFSFSPEPWLFSPRLLLSHHLGASKICAPLACPRPTGLPLMHMGPSNLCFIGLSRWWSGAVMFENQLTLWMPNNV